MVDFFPKKLIEYARLLGSSEYINTLRLPLSYHYELKVLALLRHPNINKYRESFLHEWGRGEGFGVQKA